MQEKVRRLCKRMYSPGLGQVTSDGASQAWIPVLKLRLRLISLAPDRPPPACDRYIATTSLAIPPVRP